MFKRFFTRNHSEKSRMIEESVYEIVADELSRDEKRPGLWAKAMALSEGDKDKVESIYIKLRAISISDEMKLKQEAEDLASKAILDEKKRQTHDPYGGEQVNKGRFAIYIKNERYHVVDTDDFFSPDEINDLLKCGYKYVTNVQASSKEEALYKV
ncbi:hypothetical protein GT360_21315 [Vibrio astriarenae]|uniref:Uncharacterized protein n=1 Tax=Vibrio astriarenae TaxID=1481923 RepID=A0A7Z2YGA7_9VIBR|nr:hypothetical protein [Vibrio astriarenae]QIA66034.1 hypothetical protein GT360_21315 [Vibrio astriarenae]